VRAVPHLYGCYPGICLTTEEKARKNLSHGSQITRISRFQWIILSSLTMWTHILQCKILSLHMKKYLTITTWSFWRNAISNEIKRNSSCSLHVILNYLHQEMCWMRHTARRFNRFAHTTCRRVTPVSQYTELPPPSNTPAVKALSDFFDCEWKIRKRGHCYCVIWCFCKFCVLLALRFAQSSFWRSRPRNNRNRPTIQLLWPRLPQREPDITCEISNLQILPPVHGSWSTIYQQINLRLQIAFQMLSTPFCCPNKNETIVFISPRTGRTNHPRYWG
jgi:hypothetical protein